MTMPYWETEHNAELLMRIQAAVAETGEELSFGPRMMDIGGRDGVAVPVLELLGVRRKDISIVDPAQSEVERAVASGLILGHHAHPQSLEEYVDQGGAQVDSAALFNIQPRLSFDVNFMRALGSVVRPRGLVVVTACEPATVLTFRTNAERHAGLERIASAPRSVLPTFSTSNNYLHLWRKA